MGSFFACFVLGWGCCVVWRFLRMKRVSILFCRVIEGGLGFSCLYFFLRSRYFGGRF